MPIAAVEALKADLADQPASPLRFAQVDECNDEIRRLTGQVQGKDQDGQPQPWLRQASGSSGRRIREIRQFLDANAPKKITDGLKANRVKAGIQAIVQEVIQPGLLPRSVMRRNPSGAVGHVLRTEFHREFKDAVQTVKRGLLGLDPENRDPDFTNVNERFRSEGTNPDGTSTFMADAQIPGKFAQTPLSKANWPFGEPTVDTALKQVVRREAAARSAPALKVKRPPTDKQIAHLMRLNAARAEQRRQAEGATA